MIANHETNKGQVTLEYFILFAAVAAAVIVGFQAFGADIASAIRDFFNAAANRIAK